MALPFPRESFRHQGRSSGDNENYRSEDNPLFGLPAHPKALPEVGSEVHDMPGWVTSTVREFELTGRETYDQVLVHWCAAAIVNQTAAIAA